MEKLKELDRVRESRFECLLTEYSLVDYEEIYALQKELAQAAFEDKISRPILLLLEHHGVYTLGKRGGRENLIVSESFLEEKGIGIVQIERGGNITYHGPGQLVAYPILNLSKHHLAVDTYVAGLEEVMIMTAEALGVTASRDPRNHGVWVGASKIGSVGIAIRHGVTFHGIALNVNLSLDPFTWINPCGLTGVGMTSIEKELGKTVDMENARQIMKDCFSKVFGFVLEEEEITDHINLKELRPATGN